jgi:glycosyltransferase involved in cell wall biosynthesis
LSASVQSECFPLVSIVTAVQNGLPFVRDTVKSVLSQDYPAIEYWVIDGLSRDGTVDFIKGVEASLAGWISELDEGISDAFNKGLARARGEYVMFLNSDDALALPSSISTLIAGARAAGWPDVVYGDCDLIDRSNDSVVYRARIDFDSDRFLKFHTIPHPSMLMRRSYFERHGQFDQSFHIAMDYELMLRGVPKVGATRVPVLVTNVRTGGISTGDPMRVIEESIRALRKNGYGISNSRALWIRTVTHVRCIVRRLLEAIGIYRLIHRMLRG